MRSISTFLMFMVLMFIVQTGNGQVMEKGNDDLKVVVEFISANATSENFDVDQPIVYNMQLRNNLSCPMRYTVELEVGSDINNLSITRKYVQDVTLPAHSSDMVKFEVNFRTSEELCRGEFSIWAANDSKMDVWERAWYHLKVVPLIGDSVDVESPPRQPPLIHMSTIYEGADVLPRTGTNKTHYDYQLRVFSSVEDAVTLMVAPAKTGPWTELKTKNYTDLGTWQTLSWDEVSLDFEFDVAYYKFEGRKSLGPIAGPSWPLEYFDFRNAKVAPDEGFPDSTFTYNLDVNSSNAIDVELWIRDQDKGTENFAGKRSYTNVYGWDTLEWSGVKTGDMVGTKGSPSYYFKSYRLGTNGAFNHSNDRDGYYKGPDIVLVKFENLTVFPDNVSTFVPHSYCVEVNTSLEICDIELQTSSPGSLTWVSQGIKTWKRDMGKKICWDNVTLDGHINGTVMCRFIPTEIVPKERSGPEFSAQNITSSVNVTMEQNGQTEQPTDFYRFKDPKVSPINGTNQINYQYQVDLIASDIDTVSLKVSNSTEGPWFEIGSRDYTAPGITQTLTWSDVKLNFDFDKGYYKFEGREELGPQEGPFWPIYYNYTNADVDPDFGFSSTPFNYSIEFNATKNLDIALFVRDLDLNEYRLVRKVPYRCSPLTTRLNWTGVNPIERADSNVKGKSSYYFGFYYPGSEAEINTTRKELGGPYSGPAITLITFENPRVVPDIGNYLSTYTYYVDAKTALDECDIELQTKNPNSSIWQSQGVFQYKGENETCCWNDIKLEGYGSASYRIVCDDTVLVENGPEILPINLVGHVNPSNGSLDCTYSYEVDIETIGEHKAILIELEAFDPVNEEWVSFGTQWYDKRLNTDTLKFVVDRLPFSSFLGNLTYRMVSEERVLGEFIGPEIYVDFKNECYKIEDNGTYTYNVDVRANDNLSIDLVYSLDGITWSQAGDTKSYNISRSENWQRMEWNNRPMYRMFKFKEIR